MDIPEVVVSWSGGEIPSDGTWYSKIYLCPCPRCGSKHAMLVEGKLPKPPSIEVKCKQKLGQVRCVFRT
jgi:hypothetical protein